MISIRVKFRVLATKAREGIIYYQLTEHRKVRQLVTPYKLYVREWNDDRSIIDINNSEYHRRDYLQNIERRIIRDIALLQRLATEVGGIEEMGGGCLKFNRINSLRLFVERLVEEVRREGRIKTALSYKTALKSFLVFSKCEDVSFEEVTPHLVKQYELYLKVKQVCNNTISFYMRILRAIYNRAVAEGYCGQCFPFKGVYVGIDKTVKRAVGEDVISHLRALNLFYKPGLGFARDIFMFSFYARGMAFVDVAHLTGNNVKGDYIVYERHKTGQELHVRIEPCLRDILERYAGSCPGEAYLFPILEGGEANYESALRLQNLRLRNISRLMGLPIPLTSYVARHSWATLAKKKGISTQIISESMGHNNEKTTLIYLSSLDRSVIDQANAQLLSEI